MKKIIQAILRKVVVKSHPATDVYTGKRYYPYRWELFRKFSIKTGYMPVEQYGDEQSEYLEIV